MTTSEVAERKKELSSNFTFEELIDLYLAGEWRYEESEQRAKELGEEIENLRVERESWMDVFGEAQQKIEECESRIKGYDRRHQEDCITINQLNVALDVMTEKYIRLKGLRTD